MRFFARHCILKFEIFCYKFWNKQNSDDVHWNVWTKVVRPKKYFRKLNYRYEILNQLYFGPSFVFWRTALGHFSQRFCFLIFCLWLTMVTDIFTQPPPPPQHKKASYSPVKLVKKLSYHTTYQGFKISLVITGKIPG